MKRSARSAPLHEKLATVRKRITQWERRVRRAANKLAAYRAAETRLLRLQRQEAEKCLGPRPRKFDLEQV